MLEEPLFHKDISAIVNHAKPQVLIMLLLQMVYI